MKLSYLIKYHTMKAYGGVEVELNDSLFRHYKEMSQFYPPTVLSTWGEPPLLFWIGGLVRTRTREKSSFLTMMGISLSFSRVAILIAVLAAG